ncbi:MAG TPA: S8 family serine peptidase, partial [Candidatus Limnocylindria bacterium]|nr:S8 family serine peptidase [Candidatus Limnocylindria bacterium]
MKLFATILLWLSLLALPLAVRAEVALRWDADHDRFDAKFEKLPLNRVLGMIRKQTGWKVFLEPGAKMNLTVAFTNLPVREALPKLAGGLNYALVPKPGSLPRLYIYRTQMEAASDEVSEESAEELLAGDPRIKTELIVRLKPGSKTNIDALAKSLGGRVVGRIDSLLAYRLAFDSEEAANAAKAALLENEDVAGVENNQVVGHPETPQMASGMSMAPFNLNPKVATDCDKVVVGLVDTGVQGLPSQYQQFLLPGQSVADGKPAAGELAHGSAMAETILRTVAALEKGNSSTVKILPVDVYGSSETSTTFNVAKGIAMAVKGGANVINLSLGGSGDSALLQELIHSITAQGALVFAAAGNTPVTTPTYPAAYTDVLAVTAASAPGQIAPYANRGSFIDLMAPGTSYVPYNNQMW